MVRNFGLDIVRSIAIISILLAHISPLFINNPIFFNFLYNLGLYGVELFFVLSGFLIGQVILLKLMPAFNLHNLKKFYVRRLLRILPLYYFVLISFILIEFFIYRSHSLHIFHFIFLQNLFPMEINFFAVSWTLSIQFWFYLITPIILLIITHKGKSPHQLIKGFIYIIIAINLLRLLYVCIQNPSFDFGIRKNIFLRLDTLFIGALFAIVKNKYKPLYKKLSHYKIFVISIILLTIFYIFYVYKMVINGIEYFDNSIFFRSFSFPLMSLMLISFVIFIENNTFINNLLTNKKLVYYFFTKLSLLSFSMFLIHYEIYTYFENNIKFLNTTFSIIISTIIILVLSVLLYNLIEKPILLKRNQI